MSRHSRWKGNWVRIPNDNSRCMRPNVYIPSAKAGHWETEKAWYKNAREYLIGRESEDLL